MRNENLRISEVEKSEPEKPEINIGDYFYASFGTSTRLRQLVETNDKGFAIYTPETCWIRGEAYSKEVAVNHYSNVEKVEVVSVEIIVKKV